MADANTKYTYTSFRIRKAVKDEEGKTVQSGQLRKHDENTYHLNVNVPENISPTGWANIQLPNGKFPDKDKDGNDVEKSNWFTRDHVNADGTKSERMSDIFIANNLELEGIVTGQKGAPHVGDTFKITPADLRTAVIEQSKARSNAKAAEREVPEVEGAQESLEAQAGE